MTDGRTGEPLSGRLLTNFGPDCSKGILCVCVSETVGLRYYVSNGMCEQWTMRSSVY